jgi:hypothetical protein
MTLEARCFPWAAALSLLIGMTALPGIGAAQQDAQGISIGDADVGGVVSGPNGPEAGVWVIAETTDLPTKFATMVVTDELGRYVLPGLPRANYSVWVRGYGLVDSPKVASAPGRMLNLTAVPAPDARAAAQYYPSIYWYSMLKIPDKDQFGGKSEIPEKITQADWLKQVKNIGCIGCHQLGQLSTRTLPEAFGEFRSSEEAWIRRVQSGQSGEQMINQLAGVLGGVPFKYFADWSDRVAGGRAAEGQAGTPAGRRAQHRGDVLGMAYREAVCA